MTDLTKETIPARGDGRRLYLLRPIRFQNHFAPNATGSTLIEWGNTRVICGVTIEEAVPRWMRDQKISGGWVTAEYSILPYSTLDRKQRVATGIIREGHIYGVQTAGIADCVKLDTGEIVWEERLTGAGANNAVWSSPLLAGQHLYVMNQSGDVFVYKADTKYELLSVNSVGERSNSSVVASHGNLFLRTHEALWCIGRK